MNNSAADMLLDVLQAADIQIDTHTIAEVSKVVDVGLALAVASWVDLAHPKARKAWADGQS
jgi:hypothetical protein